MTVNPGFGGQSFIDGSLEKIEENPPFDLAGTNNDPARTALPFGTATLSEGNHSVMAEIGFLDGRSEIAQASFVVDNIDPEFFLSEGELSLGVASTGEVVAEVELFSGTGEASAFTLVSNSAWLSATSSDLLSPATLSITGDSTGLSPGVYIGKITASAGHHPGVELTVILSVAQHPVVPALSRWAMLAMACLMLGLGRLRRANGRPGVNV